MIRKHALIVSLILGLAAAAGAVAAVRTAHLGQSSAKATTSTAQTGAQVLLQRQRLLNREEAALKRALSKRPPKLPKVPKFPAAAPQTQLASGSVSAAAAPRVRYVRPAPIVVVKHRSHGDEHESHDDGGGDD